MLYYQRPNEPVAQLVVCTLSLYQNDLEITFSLLRPSEIIADGTDQVCIWVPSLITANYSTSFSVFTVNNLLCISVGYISPLITWKLTQFKSDITANNERCDNIIWTSIKQLMQMQSSISVVINTTTHSEIRSWVLSQPSLPATTRPVRPADARGCEQLA